MISSTLNSGIADYDANFVNNWNTLINEFKSCKDDNKLWIAGPSSYLFKTSGVKFGVDLQIRRDADFDALKDDLFNDLSELDAVIITHEHGDHFCPRLAFELRDAKTIWYIPEGTRTDYVERSGLSEDKIKWIKPGDKWRINDVEFNTFFTPHAVGEQPFLQCGFEIVTPFGKVLIPGDIRDYDYKCYPEFNDIDLCIAHLWGGKDSSTEENYLPMLEKFSKICCDFNASRYFLCHLYEIGRKQNSLWSFKHAGLVMDMIYSLKPNAVVEVPRIGQSYDLFKIR